MNEQGNTRLLEACLRIKPTGAHAELRTAESPGYFCDPLRFHRESSEIREVTKNGYGRHQ